MTVQQRSEIIEKLLTSADPGTFVSLELLTLDELQTLAAIMLQDDVA